MTDMAARAAGDARGLPTMSQDLVLTRREHLFVAAFWGSYAVLATANGILFTRGSDSLLDITQRTVLHSVVDATFWWIVTPWILRLAARLHSGRTSRRRQVATFVATGAAVAIMGGSLTLVLRNSLRLLPPGEPPPLTTLLWFGFVSGAVLYTGILIAGFARAYSYRYRARQQHAARLQEELAIAQLDALRRQLDPHFLFNTLNLISSLVERDPRGVRRMISRLGELLRFSLEGASAPEIPLGQELALLDRYLDIMRMRFGARLEIQTLINGDTLGALVPSLLLQPLVENAIRHGVEKMRGVGRIEIHGLRDGDTLVLRVRDNGPGTKRRTPGSGGVELVGASDSTAGVGLRNTIARLLQLYGDAGGLSLGPAENGGTVAEVRIPFHLSADHGTMTIAAATREGAHAR